MKLRACACAILVSLLTRSMASAAAAPSCQSPDVFGKAWFVGPSTEGKRGVWAYVWPNGEDPRRGIWKKAASETCTTLPPDAGVIVNTPAVLQALGQGSGGSYARQLMFRLGVEGFGQARMQLQIQDGQRVAGQGQLAWPTPHKGPLTAVGPALPVERLVGVMADALGFGVLSISPGRAWQELEAFAGGLWPLEAMLVGTQITAWEQGAGNGLLAEDILGYASKAWTVVLLPSGKAASLGWILPVAKPQTALGFVQWVIEIVSGFAPSLQARSEKVQGQSMLVVRGLTQQLGVGPAPLYMMATSDALLASTEAASVVKMQRALAQAAPAPAERVASNAPQTATAFGRIGHAALVRAIGRGPRASDWLRALHLDPSGHTSVYLEASSDAWRWRTLSSSAPAAAAAAAPKP